MNRRTDGWADGISANVFRERGFEFGDAIAQRLRGLGDLFGGVARGDVLRAVPVEGDDVDDEEAFDNRCGRRARRRIDERGERGFVGGEKCARVAEDFQAFAAWVIHDEECDAFVGGEISRGEELAVAAEVREPERVSVENFEKTARTAAVLNVGPAVFVDRRKIEAVALGDELRLIFAEWVESRGRGNRARLSIGAFLGSENGRRQSEREEVCSHRGKRRGG
jgi:hypothetical protein